MSTKRKTTLLMLAGALGLGLIAVDAQPAAAHKNKGKAWGHQKHGKHKKSYQNSRYYRADRYRGQGDWRNRYDSGGDWVHRGRDIDGDGIPNDRDRDIDGDGHPNWRDHKPYGSGYNYDRGSGGRRYRRR